MDTPQRDVGISSALGTSSESPAPVAPVADHAVESASLIPPLALTSNLLQRLQRLQQRHDETTSVNDDPPQNDSLPGDNADAGVSLEHANSNNHHEGGAAPTVGMSIPVETAVQSVEVPQEEDTTSHLLAPTSSSLSISRQRDNQQRQDQYVAHRTSSQHLDDFFDIGLSVQSQRIEDMMQLMELNQPALEAPIADYEETRLALASSGSTHKLAVTVEERESIERERSNVEMSHQLEDRRRMLSSWERKLKKEQADLLVRKNGVYNAELQVKQRVEAIQKKEAEFSKRKKTLYSRTLSNEMVLEKTVSRREHLLAEKERSISEAQSETEWLRDKLHEKELQLEQLAAALEAHVEERRAQLEASRIQYLRDKQNLLKDRQTFERRLFELDQRERKVEDHQRALSRAMQKALRIGEGSGGDPSALEGALREIRDLAEQLERSQLASVL